MCVINWSPAGWDRATPLPFCTPLLPGVIFDRAAVLCCCGRTNHHMLGIIVVKVMSTCYHPMPLLRCDYNATWSWYSAILAIVGYRYLRYRTALSRHGVTMSRYRHRLAQYRATLSLHGSMYFTVEYIHGAVIERNGMVVHGRGTALTTLAWLMHTDGTVVHFYSCVMD